MLWIIAKLNTHEWHAHTQNPNDSLEKKDLGEKYT